MWYKLDENKNPIPCTVNEYCEWNEKNAEKSIVQQDTIENTRVSTVFLGLDHGFKGTAPVLWETMIFSGDTDFDQYQKRYTSFDDAVIGHLNALTYVKYGIIPS